MTRLRLPVCWFKQIMPESGHGAFLFLVAALPRCALCVFSFALDQFQKQAAEIAEKRIVEFIEA